ncbi:MAG: hypothetical protein CMJ50_08860 [Planctomycetaceae bacterium]|nr:hypothetical protein [Planctomycetaceae bacterium]
MTRYEFRHRLFNAVIIAFSCSVAQSALTARADSFFQLNLAELIAKADWVVVGTASVEEGDAKIRVTEVLKGDAPMDKIATRDIIKSTLVFKDEDQGVFFLRKWGDNYWPFHPSSFVPMSERQKVRDLLRMRKDPSPYVDKKRYPPDENIVFQLGELFGGFKVTCKEFPQLESAGTVWNYFEYVPWNEESKVVLKGTVDENNAAVVEVVTAPPKSEMAEFYQRTLKEIANPYNRVTGPYTLTVESRVPEKVGKLNREDCVKYLHECLESSERKVVRQAITALAKMRNSDSIVKVESLLEDEDATIAGLAIEFLRWSRDKRAVPVLCGLVDSHAERYPEGHMFSDGAAQALQAIGDPECLPCLERAAIFGVQRAIEALGAMGRVESFEIMLNAAERKPEKCAFVDYALYGLVRRSNKKSEPWMTSTTWNIKQGAKNIPRWRKWWESNKGDFKLKNS